MHPASRDDEPTEGAVLRSMVLLSTLSTAAEVWHAVKERRAGRDPSDQEAPAVAAPHLETGRRELQQMLVRLRASLVYARHRDEGETAHLVRRFDDLMTLGRVGRLLHLIHQRLLSLYPAVSEALVEAARCLEGTCSRLGGADDAAFEDELGPFLEETLLFAARLQQEVG